MNPFLSIVFSFRNEEEVLPELIKRCRAVLSKEKEKGVISGWELIFVNDASTGHSEEVLKGLAKGHDDIRIITMVRNQEANFV